MPLLIRLLLAAGAGGVLYTAFPTLDLWFLAPVGIALLTAACAGAGPAIGALLGFVAGMVFFVPTLEWSGIYVGMLPWIALSVLQSLYIAVLGLLLTLTRHPVLMTPLAWVVSELLRSTTPFGGFPWVRIAFSQADSPLATWASVAGAPGVTFAVAVVGASLYAVARLIRDLRLREHPAAAATTSQARRNGGNGSGGVGWVATAATLGAASVMVAGGFLIPRPSDGTPVPIAMIQGNVPRPGLDFNAERRAVLDNHVRGTELAAAEVGEVRPDDLSLVIWPENSSDIDPFRNADAAAVIQEAVTAANAPILVGAVVERSRTTVANVAPLFRPGGPTTEAEVEQYVKQHPVPFAEYIPYRNFFRMLSSKVDLVPRDFVAGDEPVVFDLEAASTAYTAVPTICFEVAYDGLMRDVLAAAEDRPSILVVQTNNATFGYSAEAEQQFAISRIRAIEHGRSVAHVSTVGVSGFIAPDGSTTEVTGLFTARQLIDTPVVRTGVTISDRLGRLPEILASAGVLLLLGRHAIRRRRRGIVLAPARRPEESAREQI
ncbi:MAG TPA: apolipoprotein N-acyltransferase [Intrasporangiaceae bacterium]|nr:apolipoprotein N-acyltransferase [Intrasporangiaceae bacterium]